MMFILCCLFAAVVYLLLRLFVVVCGVSCCLFCVVWFVLLLCSVIAVFDLCVCCV